MEANGKGLFSAVVGQKLTGEKLIEKLKNGQKLNSEYVVNENSIN